jgi:hypothetical protein
MEPKPNPFLIASLIKHGGDQTLLHLTLASTVMLVLMIFVTGFLLGLWCGWMRRRQQTRVEAGAALKSKARA